MASSHTPNIFYTEVTTVREGDVNLPLVTLPPGTILFRAVKIPNREAGEDARFFYRDYLGTPEDMKRDGRVVKKLVCLPPTHNVFFYPFPFIGFGTHDYGKNFHSIQVVVLVHPMTLVCNVGPSEMSRGDTRAEAGGDIYARCDKFEYDCRPQTSYEIEAKSYDNCLNPHYQQRSGTRGWMAIANLDSLFPTQSQEERKRHRTSPMASYVSNIEKTFPGQGAELLAWTYTDNRNHKGYPEIALFPYHNHPGPNTIVRSCENDEDAIQIMLREASRNNLNYLPLAQFLKEGIVDMVNGKYDLSCLPSDQNTFGTNPTFYQGEIEEHMRNWMNHVETEGLDLPPYGKQRLHFDSRTGFFVFPQMIPTSLQVKTNTGSVPYSQLLFSLQTEQDRNRALQYMIIFRKFLPEQAFQRFGLDKQFGVYRAMVFNRPPAFKDLFDRLKIQMPDTYKKAYFRAVAQYKKNTGEESKADIKRKEVKEKLEAEFNDALRELQPANSPPSTFTANSFTIVGTKTQNVSIEDSLTLSTQQYQNFFTTAGRQADLIEDQKSKPYIFRNQTDAANADKRVKGKLDYYFSHLPESERWKIQLDDVALFSVTEPAIANQQSLIIRKALRDIVGEEALAQATITDATACVGGNTISFADFFFVNSVEMSPQRARMLANNIRVFGKQSKVHVFSSDYTQIMNDLKQDVVFFDPPWGGTSYKEKEKIDMFLGPHNIIDLSITLLKGGTKLVAIKAPTNYNTDEVNLKMFSAGITNIKTVDMPKMLLILIQAPEKTTQNGNMKGGYRKTRSHHKKNPRKTRRVTKEKGVGFGLAHLFHRVWRAHAKANS
jgi:16S rRNA G966 N2-methylase RsmD